MKHNFKKAIMKQIKITALIGLLFCLLLSSCRVSLVPAYNPDVVAKVEQASKATDHLYDSIMDSPDKSFYSFSNSYASIHSQIDDILILDSSRESSKIILIIGNDLKKRFVKYEKYHKDAGTLNNSQLRTYKDYMHALWESLFNSEINFKIK